MALPEGHGLSQVFPSPDPGQWALRAAPRPGRRL